MKTETVSDIIEHEVRLSEKQKVLMAIAYVSHLIDKNYETVLQPFNLTVAQYNLMRILLKTYPDGLKIVDIKAQILDRNSDVPRLIDRLINNDFVKSQKEKNVAAKFIYLTEKGYDTLDQVSRHMGLKKPVSQITNEEAKQLNTLLLKIIRPLTATSPSQQLPDVKFIIKSGVLIIYPESNLLSNPEAQPVSKLVSSLLSAGNYYVLFNLSSVTYMNSNGLHLLLSTHKKLKQAGGKMALCNVTEYTEKILRITRLDSILNCLPDEQTAIDFLKSQELNDKTAA